MRKHLRFGFVLLFIFGGFDGIGQRKLPYPIIFIHGLGGSHQSWNDFASYLNSTAGLNVPTNSWFNSLDFNLNCDGNTSTSWYVTDYCDITNTSYLINCDAYIIDFNYGTRGNQSAIFKQGLAIRDAIKHVRNVTGADKVILMGHSMGGLAARDYLQNSTKWQSDGQHHVAKLVTVGTPHGGSNGSSGNLSDSIFGPGISELSEAVRDLRYSYTTGYDGAYLFGEYENTSRVSGRVSNFFNVDINCNGITGDYITGVNQYPSSLPTNLTYSCIIGTGKSTYMGLYGLSSTTDGDQIVESYRANLNNYFGVNASVFNIYTNNSYTVIPNNNFHTNLLKDFPIQNVWALDEPSTFNHSYEIYANATSTNTGFFTQQSNGSTYDTDRYKVYVQKGITKIEVNAYQGSYPSIRLYNPYQSNIANSINATSTSMNTLIHANLNSGYHYFDFEGYSGTTWRSYNYKVYNAPSSSLYANATSTCNQGSVTLTATESGFDSYQWYKDGVYITTTATNYINASTTANGTSTYTVKTTKWGVTIDGLNSWQFKDYSIPPPTLTASLGGVSTTSSLNICNGTGVVLSTNCGANTIPLWQNYATSATLYVNATSTTNYTVQCSNYFCTSANSPPVRIVNEPNIQSVKTGNWQAPDTWSCNCVPINCQNVTVQTGHTVNHSRQAMDLLY
ncbi:MAG: GPI inositol-deacylase [Arcicella sp.]|jgi:pimeloyl-ACP methyl ester carboxylesterase|nr:GPI inositol-deacylase [Arcicella sp.]